MGGWVGGMGFGRNGGCFMGGWMGGEWVLDGMGVVLWVGGWVGNGFGWNGGCFMVLGFLLLWFWGFWGFDITWGLFQGWLIGF